ncbi:MAG: Gfo/Idh/MocA family oxidoreductase [Betaproteobacteria bacterium]
MKPLGPEKRLRIGFAGAGAISLFHLIGWKQIDKVEVVAICDSTLEKAQARAQEFGVERVYSDFARMLAREALDAVAIATPVATHANGLRTGRQFQTDRLDNLKTLRLMESAYVAAGISL